MLNLPAQLEARRQRFLALVGELDPSKLEELQQLMAYKTYLLDLLPPRLATQLDTVEDALRTAQESSKSFKAVKPHVDKAVGVCGGEGAGGGAGACGRHISSGIAVDGAGVRATEATAVEKAALNGTPRI